MNDRFEVYYEIQMSGNEVLHKYWVIDRQEDEFGTLPIESNTLEAATALANRLNAFLDEPLWA